MATRNPMFGNNRLKLGIFSANCSSGMVVTKIEERWQNSWDNNIRLARLCDEAGLEFLLPIARWIGNGGDTDFSHPIVTAKQLATIDQLGNGRVGVNVVAGWKSPARPGWPARPWPLWTTPGNSPTSGKR